MAMDTETVICIFPPALSRAPERHVVDVDFVYAPARVGPMADGNVMQAIRVADIVVLESDGRFLKHRWLSV